MAKRVDEVDGIAYTYDELAAHYAGSYKKKDIEAYWETCKPAKGNRKDKAAPAAEALVEAGAKSTSKEGSKSKAMLNMRKLFASRTKDIAPDEKTDEGTGCHKRQAIKMGPRGMEGLGPRAIKVKEGVSVLHLFGAESKQRSGFEIWFLAPGCTVRWGEYIPPADSHSDYELIIRNLQGDLGLGIGDKELRRFQFRDLCLVPNLVKAVREGGIIFQNQYSDKPAVVFCAIGPCAPTGLPMIRTPAGFTPGKLHARKNWLQAMVRVLEHRDIKKNNGFRFSHLQKEIVMRWKRMGIDSKALSGKIPTRQDDCVFSTTDAEPFIFTEKLHNGQGDMTRHSFFNDKSRQSSTVQIWDITPGSTEGMHIHAGSGNDMPSVGALEEMYVCLAGKGKITLKDGEDLELGIGDAAIVPASVWHGVENTSDFDAGGLGQNFFLMVCWASEEAPGLQARSHIQGRKY